ncbi:MAG: SCO7613 C-terminal domain-containing membrane protein, partial [Nocardioidaceae bacterium]
DVVRVGLETTTIVVAVVATSLQLDHLLALAVGLTLLGTGAIVLSFLSEDRRWVAWLGSVLLVLASWVRLFELEVDTIEAYTLPGAVALLVAGLVWMRRTPGATSWQALGAPLGMALGPSLVVALGEPTSVRALLVGLVGLALVGTAVVMRWGAPLLAGGASVALLALANIAPYAAALPRWVLFGTAGVALLALGVTWEQRRHDIHTMQRYAARLR